MPFKPNYNHQRAERDRATQAKREAKLREREDARERRKLAQELTPTPSGPRDEEPSGR